MIVVGTSFERASETPDVKLASLRTSKMDFVWNDWAFTLR